MDGFKNPSKLASAVYLLTNFFDEKEPLKWKLRSLSSELISLWALTKDGLSGEGEVAMVKTRRLISEIMDFLSLARNVGLISPPNHDLLYGEFMKYRDSLGRQTEIAELFSPERSLEDARDYQQRQFLAASFEQKGQINQGQSLTYAQKDKTLKKFGAVSVKKNNRQSIIISLLKRKKEIMIKDVSPLISNCSEKTIQRELMAMVRSGLLKKTGDRRWSRYSLA